MFSCVCQADFVNTDPQNPAVCECGPGFGFDVERGLCEPCPQGAYKEVGGNVLCSSCPPDQSTLQEASKSAESCLCQPGLSLDNVSCSRCPSLGPFRPSRPLTLQALNPPNPKLPKHLAPLLP